MVEVRYAANAAFWVPQSSAPKHSWLDTLPLYKGSGSSAIPAAGLYTFPTRCSLNSPFKKAQKPFSMPPFLGEQENEGAVSLNKAGSLVYGRENVCSAA